MVHVSFERLTTTRGNITEQTRAWKLLLLTSRMLLHRCNSQGKAGIREFQKRISMFQGGHFLELLNQARLTSTGARLRRNSQEDDVEARARLATHHVRIGEVSRARHCLTSAPLAPT